jgi:hypothetical protein
MEQRRVKLVVVTIFSSTKHQLLRIFELGRTDARWRLRARWCGSEISLNGGFRALLGRLGSRGFLFGRGGGLLGSLLQLGDLLCGDLDGLGSVAAVLCLSLRGLGGVAVGVTVGGLLGGSIAVVGLLGGGVAVGSLLVVAVGGLGGVAIGVAVGGLLSGGVTIGGLLVVAVGGLFGLLFVAVGGLFSLLFVAVGGLDNLRLFLRLLLDDGGLLSGGTVRKR